MSEEAKPKRGVSDAAAGAFAGGPGVYTPLDPARALVPAVVRVHETVVARGFWPKLRKVARHIPFGEDVLAVWFCAFDRETSVATKATLLAALAFFVMPKGFLPKRMATLIFVDEAAAVAAAIAAVGKAIKPHHREAARAALGRLSGD